MRFSTDEIKPFYEVRQNLSKAIDEVGRDGSEIVIAKHGKPVAALLSAAGLYRYRAINLLMARLLDHVSVSESSVEPSIDPKVRLLLLEIEKLLRIV